MLSVRKIKSGIQVGLVVLIILSAMFITGCKAKSSNSASDGNADPAHNAKNSLDYNGSYYGVLPAADAAGMEVIITLNQDSSYQKIVRYLGKNEHQSYEDYGKYTWNEAGNTITLEGIRKPNMYFVGENTLTQLDSDGKKIKGKLAEKYVLAKLVEE